MVQTLVSMKVGDSFSLPRPAEAFSYQRLARYFGGELDVRTVERCIRVWLTAPLIQCEAEYRRLHQRFKTRESEEFLHSLDVGDRLTLPSQDCALALGEAARRLNFATIVYRHGSKFCFALTDRARNSCALPRIESGIPQKENKAGQWRQMLNCVVVGDSFLTGTEREDSKIHAQGKQLGVKLMSTSTGDGFRAWVVARNSKPADMPEGQNWQIEKNLPIPRAILARITTPIVIREVLEGKTALVPPEVKLATLRVKFCEKRIRVRFFRTNGELYVERLDVVSQVVSTQRRGVRCYEPEKNVCPPRSRARRDSLEKSVANARVGKVWMTRSYTRARSLANAARRIGARVRIEKSHDGGRVILESRGRAKSRRRGHQTAAHWAMKLLGRMREGDSVVVRNQNDRVILLNSARAMGLRATSAKAKEGFRVWCLGRN